MPVHHPDSYLDILLAIFPIGFTFLLVVFASLNASVAMGITTLLLYGILKALGRQVSLKEMITGSIDKRCLSMFFAFSISFRS